MADKTETLRRAAKAVIDHTAGPRSHMEAQYGRVWDTEEMQEDFRVVGFAAPYVVVVRKSDGAKGSLAFAHSPRFYFNFMED